MDVRMPVLDGIEATKRIRDLLPKARIVAYAGSDDANDVMAMMEAGANAYCVKGAPLWELERATRRRQRPTRPARARHLAVDERRRDHRARCARARRSDRRLVRRDVPRLADTRFRSLPSPGPSPGVAPFGARDRRRARSQSCGSPRPTHTSSASSTGSAPPAPRPSQRRSSPTARLFGALLVALPANVQLERRPGARRSRRRPRLGRACQRAQARADVRRGPARCADRPRQQARLRRAPGGSCCDADDDEQPVSLVLFDLDDFKQINDQEGHLVGDDVLREVGRVLMRVVRAERRGLPVGGEEFASSWRVPRAMRARSPSACAAASPSQRRGHRAADRLGRASRPFPSTRAARRPPCARRTSLSTPRSSPGRTA